MKKLTAFALLLTIFLPACGSAPSGTGVSTPLFMTAEVSTVIAVGSGTEVAFPTPETPTPIPTLARGLSVTELKYRVLKEFPNFFFCDPDYYPVAHDDEMALALKSFPELQANQEEFETITKHLGSSGSSTFTDAQKLDIYQDYKMLNAIHFQLVDGKYQFQILTGQEGQQQGTIITGTIGSNGSINVLKREPGFLTCPICLAAGTLIDTPRGAIRVEDLRVGDTVWTQDEAGQRVLAPLSRTGRVRVPATHQMIHITLSDGRELWASAGHPTADGRRMADLKKGTLLDGAQIIQVEHIRYEGTYTFDILPAGATGFYWANGILMGSTMSSP